MTLNLTKEEKNFLLESLNYAEMYFDQAITSYPDFAKMPRDTYHEKRIMFKKIREKIQSVESS